MQELEKILEEIEAEHPYKVLGKRKIESIVNYIYRKMKEGSNG